MSFSKSFVVLLISLFYCTTNHAQSRTDLWSKDISYLKTELASRHKNLFFKTSQSTFNHKLDSIINEVDNLSDIEISIALQEVIAFMGDDHTSIYNPKLLSYGQIPIWLNWFKDGIYILNTIPEYHNLLFKKVVAFNDLPIENIVSKVLNVSSKTNEAVSKNHFLYYFSYKAILEYYGIIDSDSMQISYLNNKGNIEKQNIKCVVTEKGEKINWMGFGTVEKVLCEKNKNKLFWYEYDESTKVLYAQYNKCLSKEVMKRYGNKKQTKNYPSFKKFSSDILKILESEQVEKFVFDMRYNPGGSSDQGTRLVKEIAKVKSINQKGKIFVIVGRKTFSSAILNSLDFQNYTEAIFVGEPTGGKPNHYGEIRKLILPNQGLKVNYSTKYFTHSKTDDNSFYPDYEITTTFEEYKNGIDPVVEWILNY